MTRLLIFRFDSIDHRQFRTYSMTPHSRVIISRYWDLLIQTLSHLFFEDFMEWLSFVQLKLIPNYVFLAWSLFLFSLSEGCSKIEFLILKDQKVQNDWESFRKRDEGVRRMKSIHRPRRRRRQRHSITVQWYVHSEGIAGKSREHGGGEAESEMREISDATFEVSALFIYTLNYRADLIYF